MGVFTVLVACGLGLPMPEDIALITGGYLAGIGPPKGVGSVWGMVFVGLAGILVGDSIIFHAGSYYGDKLLETRVGRHIPSARIARTRELFEKHGSKMIMVARFLPGLRAVTYFVAGTSRIPYWKFLTFDGIAACVSAPVWVYLGYWAGKHHAKARAFAAAKQFQVAIVIAMVVGAAGILAWTWLKRRRAKALQQQRLLEANTMEPVVLRDGAAVARPAEPPADRRANAENA